MIKFTNEPESWKRLDYEIIASGFLKPYNDYSVLGNDTEWLHSEGYKIITFDCSEWVNNEMLHNSLHSKFDFPVYYGHNWDALQECLNEIEIQDNGLVVVFDSLDTINIKNAHMLIDIFVSSAQRHLIFSQRLLILIKVESRNFRLNDFGGFYFRWY
ncbi:barstar family protein [Flavobacterium sp. F-65]|uniref:Barstar family protein n=1 Tax=Flavobacterium pisciphilum TaxID=2893755 RepID=A0ABS8MRD6_9FLAO|nr:barstar family protein [Flavobacterium sp. F-65]MCC9071335.1 barstar family protein [Flavobacterium sp. F-65]